MSSRTQLSGVSRAPRPAFESLVDAVFMGAPLCRGWRGRFSSDIVLQSCLDREIHSSPRRKPARQPACDLVCERNSVVRIRSQVGMSLEVTERLCDLGGSRK